MINFSQEQIANELSPMVAAKEISQNKLAEFDGGTETYQCQETWHFNEVLKNNYVAIAQGYLELEALFKDPKIEIIAVPKNNIITNDIIEYISKNSGLPKKIFFE